MASEHINGTYAPHKEQNGHYASSQAYSQAPSSTTSTTSNQNADIPKDEVGWYFVEQYYTTLSKNPDKLYLYYNKRSQFVSGNETDKVQVCVGQRAINDRIKELDFHDCKVRITNVDSQASDLNIVIQVIGEISNKSQPHRKFIQTFVLGTQTNGYFVLNDIFRYIIEEEDDIKADVTEEEQAEEQQQPVVESEQTKTEEPKTLTSSTEPAAVEHDATTASKETEKELVNGHTESAAPEEKADIVNEAPERPAEPEPTPVASPPKQAAAQPAAAPKPSGPKSWASMAASAVKTGPKPAVPAVPSTKSAPTAPSTAPAPAASSRASAAPATTAPAGEIQEKSTAPDSQDEWTPVGSSHTRQQSRQVNTQQQSDGPLRRGYIKNVRENVDGAELRQTLEKFGRISYFDIAQQKNCAFVDFESAEGYQAAVAANPHTVGGESFTIEERKIRPGQTPYVPRGQFQGGRGARGDARGGRGGSAPRGRGGQAAGRGARGGAA